MEQSASVSCSKPATRTALHFKTTQGYIVGHSDFKTTQGYIDLAGETFREEAELLEARLFGGRVS
jgi:hypothetical protein